MRCVAHSSRFARFARLMGRALLLTCAVRAIGCKERAKPHSQAMPKAALSKPSASVNMPPAAPRREPAVEMLSVSEIPDEARSAPTASGSSSGLQSKLVIDEPQDIGPAGQMSASALGVVMINRADEFQLA